ncbi:FAD-binding protein [Xylanimonas ulmi]|uniref:succinate dehydrogenase n=1 Tax=Xylanimonas ulmi TaxID=228973 RepID=A0A4Q7M5Q1_9MICO|nr:FAD-binding protein [Xylanibacterium ulmi]RZS62781.1 fumarate reductase flavoprotein subunit [Xylanibacterium ulmi]
MTVRVEHADVIVVGGGAAGLSAALAAVESFAAAGRDDAVVALVSKVYPMRSHTVAAEGGAAGVVPGGDDTLDQHVADTLAGGAGLAHEAAVRYVVERAPAELARLERLGMPWSRTAEGRPAVRRFGGMSRPRTWFAADKTGFHLLHTLFQTSLRHEAIRRYDEHVTLDLLRADGEFRGVVCHDQRRGERVVLLGGAVVLATGGYARAWATSTNAGIVTGDGLAMALRAGLALRDLEMVQVHPTCLPGSGILITEAVRGEGGVLLDADGERYLADYGLGPVTPVGAPEPRRMELGPRDKLSQAFWHADRDGRTVPTRDGGVVHLDLRHLGKAFLDERLPLVTGLARRFAGVDPAHELVPVRPAAHYTMGGVPTTAQGAVVDGQGARVAGLFAAGECASTGLHGANRLGSNSLVETLVVGRAAGQAAARAAGVGAAGSGAGAVGAGGVGEAALVDQARGLAERWLAMRGRGGESPAALRRELGAVLDADVGVYRDADGLARAAAALDGLHERYQDVRVADTSDVLNTDWTQAIELGAMLAVARGVVAAAIARTESRGAHQRLDHPQSDDVARHSLVTLGADGAVDVRFEAADTAAQALAAGGGVGQGEAGA